MTQEFPEKRIWTIDEILNNQAPQKGIIAVNMWPTPPVVQDVQNPAYVTKKVARCEFMISGTPREQNPARYLLVYSLGEREEILHQMALLTAANSLGHLVNFGLWAPVRPTDITNVLGMEYGNLSLPFPRGD